MSGKKNRMIRKGLNAMMRSRQEISDSLVLELLNAPLKYRLMFAFRLVFRRRADGKVEH